MTHAQFISSRIFAKNKCLSCGDKIHSNEFVYRTSEYIFHLRCFVCVVCGCQLQKGDQFVVKACQLFCRTDYEKEVEMLQSFNYGTWTFIDFRRQTRNVTLVIIMILQTSTSVMNCAQRTIDEDRNGPGPF